MTAQAHDAGSCATVIRLDERQRNDGARLALLEDGARRVVERVTGLELWRARVIGYVAGAAAVAGAVGALIGSVLAKLL